MRGKVLLLLLKWLLHGHADAPVGIVKEGVSNQVVLIIRLLLTWLPKAETGGNYLLGVAAVCRLSGHQDVSAVYSQAGIDRIVRLNEISRGRGLLQRGAGGCVCIISVFL